MAFNVSAVSSSVTLSMNKFTNVVISTYFQVIHVPIIETSLV